MKAATRALVLATMLIPSVSAAQQPRISDADRQEIVNQVIEHFRRNPGELLGTITSGKTAAEAAGVGNADFEGGAQDPWSGVENAEYTVMVFSDYGCTPCNDVEKMLDGLVAERKDVRIVHRDYPVSGENSVAASLDVIGAFNSRPQQDWKKLRAELMAKGVQPEYRIQALRAAGIDEAGETPASVKLTLLKNRELARRAGVKNLPAVIVMKGDGVVPISGTVTRKDVDKALALLNQD